MATFRNNTRVAQVYRAGKWEDTAFQDVHKYDVFKLFEADGTLVKDKTEDGKESSIAVALNDVYLGKDDVLTVNCVLMPDDIKP